MTPQAVRSRFCEPFLSGRGLVFFLALAVMLWILVHPTWAPDSLARAGMPSQVRSSAFMEMQPFVHREASGSDAVPAPIAWVDDMRNALGRYMWNHPDPPLSPYLETLTLVRDAVGRGDRQTVKREMETYFRMLAMRAQGISEAAAKELSAAAVRFTPAQAYGISIPASLRR